MKLQRRFAYAYESKDGMKKKHYKYQVIIREQIVRELAWKPGIDLQERIEDGKLILEQPNRKGDGSSKREK